MKNLRIVLLLLLISACIGVNPVEKTWEFMEAIDLEEVNPIGITELNGQLWLSDGDHNRVVMVDRKGGVKMVVDSLDRPMHLSNEGKLLYVPQYGKDEVGIIRGKEISPLTITDSLDAPAAVDVNFGLIAIADFYNNRILVRKGNTEFSFGKEGKGEGEFYYPTDVQITAEEIWIADAYNNRIQVFDHEGQFKRMFGKEQKMNAATGIFVGQAQVFVTDFENDRVLVFDREGKYLQELKEGIDKPTDVIISDGELWVTNYRMGQLVKYR